MTPPALPAEAGEMVKAIEQAAEYFEQPLEAARKPRWVFNTTAEQHIALKLREAMVLIERLAPRWISVEERLPDYDQWCALLELGKCVGGYRRDNWSGGFCTQKEGGGTAIFATHWLHLPPQKGST